MSYVLARVGIALVAVLVVALVWAALAGEWPRWAIVAAAVALVAGIVAWDRLVIGPHRG